VEKGEKGDGFILGEKGDGFILEPPHRQKTQKNKTSPIYPELHEPSRERS
jgi:hypothetical protein